MSGLRARLARDYGPLWLSVGRGSLSLISGTVVGAGLVYLTTPILTRVFDPSALGVYAVYVSLVSLGVSVASLRFEEAVALPSDDEEAWLLVQSALANVLRFSLLALAAVALASLGRALGVHPWQIPPTMWLVPAGVFFSAGQAVFLRWLVRKERYRPSVRARIVYGATMAADQPALGLSTGLRSGSTGALALASGDAIATAAAFAITASGTGHAGTLRSILRVRGDKQVMRRYRPFLSAGLPATLINVVSLQLPLLVLATLYGSSSAGQFALVQRLFLAPVAVITSAVTLVLVRQASLLGNDVAGARRMFWRVTGVLAVVGSPLLIFALFDFSSLVGNLFGASWVPAAQMLRSLAPLYFVNLVATPWGATVHSAARQDLFLARESVRLAMLLIAVVAIRLAAPSAVSAVTVLAWVGVASYLWYFAVCSWALDHPHQLASQARSSAGSVP